MFTANFASDKIIALEDAAKKIAEFKQAGKKVGLCHGGFDLLHPGHIRHFESAARMCDYLFVSVTSDRFVTSRKGIGRPIFSEKLRAYSIACLQFVDFVVISDFETAVEVIGLLKPSFYIKGPDFASKTTPGIFAEREAIAAAGGEVRYTADQKLSTTDIISSIRKADHEKVLAVVDRDGTLIENVDYLGKEAAWKSQVKLKKAVVDFISYIQAKFDSVKVVVSNQQGVARSYFTAKTVEEVNAHVDSLLNERGIAIDSWQFCPYADSNYAAASGIFFNPDYVREESGRKPATSMVLAAMQQLGFNINQFDKIMVIGDSEDDELLAKNLGAVFVDANLSYEGMKALL
ncbi:HAD-IIIA family hydrolase [Candidatus Woesearchaeota archaeon]|nr:HAD-IIIA family hydrolase [Candidatus Woesearchaeota archaeon]